MRSIYGQVDLPEELIKVQLERSGIETCRLELFDEIAIDVIKGRLELLQLDSRWSEAVLIAQRYELRMQIVDALSQVCEEVNGHVLTVLVLTSHCIQTILQDDPRVNAGNDFGREVFVANSHEAVHEFLQDAGAPNFRGYTIIFGTSRKTRFSIATLMTSSRGFEAQQSVR